MQQPSSGKCCDGCENPQQEFGAHRCPICHRGVHSLCSNLWNIPRYQDSNDFLCQPCYIQNNSSQKISCEEGVSDSESSDISVSRLLHEKDQELYEESEQDNISTSKNVPDPKVVPDPKNLFYNEFTYDAIYDDSTNARSLAKAYSLAGQKWAVITCMQVGYKFKDVQSFEDLKTTEPYCKMKRDLFFPGLELLKLEAARRIFCLHNEGYQFLDSKGRLQTKLPSVKNYKIKDAVEALLKYKPELQEKDTRFLDKIWSQIHAAATTVLIDAQNSNNTDWYDFVGWRNFLPNLRLIEILSMDHMKLWFIKRNDQYSREEKDAHKTDKARPDFWEEVRILFNNHNFKPTSKVLDASWGPWWDKERDLSWEQLTKYGIAPIAKHTTMRDHYTDITSRLETVRNNWKSSGSGDDQYNEEVEQGINSAPDILRWKGGKRLDFLGEKVSPIVMYAWWSFGLSGILTHTTTHFAHHVSGDGVIDVDDDENSKSSIATKRSSATYDEEILKEARNGSKQMKQIIDLLQTSEMNKTKSDLTNQINDLKKERRKVLTDSSITDIETKKEVLDELAVEIGNKEKELKDLSDSSGKKIHEDLDRTPKSKSNSKKARTESASD
jgi:hypothetical protein